jgi:hypothetical protein
VTEHPEETPDAADLAVTEWLALPDLAERLGLDVLKARQVIKDRLVIGRRRGPRLVFGVPAEFVQDGQVLKGLPGTLSVLRDSGFDDDASLRWLFTEDDSLPGTPVRALRENRGTEVRRRAQAAAF